MTIMEILQRLAALSSVAEGDLSCDKAKQVVREIGELARAARTVLNADVGPWT
jgi:hypothetical protein